MGEGPISPVHQLLSCCWRLGATVFRTSNGTLRVRAPAPLPESLLAVLQCHKAELLAFLYWWNREFLPRPVGQENNLQVWNAWTPFMLSLLEHHPHSYYAICDAEDAINALERRGLTDDPRYEAACHTLKQRFEEGRKLKVAAKKKEETTNRRRLARIHFAPPLS